MRAASRLRGPRRFLGTRRSYYQGTDAWRCGSYSALLGATPGHGQHIKTVIATTKNLDATLRTNGVNHVPQRH